MGVLLCLAAALCLLGVPTHTVERRCFTKKVHCRHHNVPDVFDFDYSFLDKFGLDFFRETAMEMKPKGVFLSPYSVWSALSLALVGAEGRSRCQLEHALGLPHTKRIALNRKSLVRIMLNVETEGVAISELERAYFSKQLRLSHCLDAIHDFVKKIDFRNPVLAADKINNDISNATRSLITNVVDPGALTRVQLMLLSAIYFKGTWRSPFEEALTEPRDFFDEHGFKQEMKVDMMKQTAHFNFTSSRTLGADVLELPYGTSHISMLLLLPSHQDPSVDHVLESLNPESLSHAVASLHPTMVKLQMPKFKLTSTLDEELTKALKSLGIVTMFNPVYADFSSFTNSTKLYVSSAIHRATVEVSEEGTVAAAVTMLSFTRSFTQTHEFNLNRPFIFVIYEKESKVTLFAGVFRSPKDTEKVTKGQITETNTSNTQATE